MDGYLRLDLLAEETAQRGVDRGRQLLVRHPVPVFVDLDGEPVRLRDLSQDPLLAPFSLARGGGEPFARLFRRRRFG